MIQRAAIAIRGAVQGVGFRPFIYRIAKEHGITGFVLNSPAGVFIEAEQEPDILQSFLLRIENEKPVHAIIQSLEFSFLDAVNYPEFEIRESESTGITSAIILPDSAVCADCLKEMFDSKDRRYLYPFITCTHCGPRFSIITSLPYDRPNTSMNGFPMCAECAEEYTDPTDRRFHAQPIACPKCGPQVWFVTCSGEILAERNDAIDAAAERILQGRIIALKGLGGYQLICRADDETTIALLRKRKQRENKPFALLFPDLKSVKNMCDVSPLEERLLLSPESPIVLLQRIKSEAAPAVHESVAPDSPLFGVMLPYTPLHHLLMKKLGMPVIATSGNLSEEPMCITEAEAFDRLRDIADYFLIHDRPIVRHVDDSIVRVVLGREMMVRRARGYAPLPIELLKEAKGGSIFAVGAHLKNTIALSSQKNVFISQHIGDLSTHEAYSAFQNVVHDFAELYGAVVTHVAADLHPDYLSTKFAASMFKKICSVQHHQAHVASCYAENRLEGPVLGVAWDGSGFGSDGTLWGGEFFLYDGISFQHAAQFRKFPLPGGEQAIKEPRRSALGLLFALYGENLFSQKIELLKQFSDQEINILRQMLQKKMNAPMTSSVGRLFDAAASLLGIQQISAYEGEAAMKLEFAAASDVTEYYPFELLPGDVLVIDWQKLIEAHLQEIKNSVPLKNISAKFHNSLAEIICTAAESQQQERIVLSGGVFQNAYLLERTVQRLSKKGFKPYWHQRVPTNDGGISLGQIAAAIAQNEMKTESN